MYVSMYICEYVCIYVCNLSIHEDERKKGRKGSLLFFLSFLSFLSFLVFTLHRDYDCDYDYGRLLCTLVQLALAVLW